MERISVYLDGANFFHGLRTIRQNYTDSKFDFEKFIALLSKNRKLIQAYYYNASLKKEKNPEIFKKQQDLFNRLRQIPLLKLVLCKRQKWDDETGCHFRIKGDDIHLAIDMLNDACENRYDTAILISGDGDFAPLVRYVKRKGKRVENYYFEKNISLQLLRECDSSFKITKKTVNKLFYRGNQHS